MLADNPNEHLCSLLSRLEDIHRIAGRPYQAAAYKKTILSLKNMPALTINNISDVTGGAIMKKKLREYLSTGTISEVESLESEYASYKELSKILGAGPATISKWIADDIKTVAQLRLRVSKGYPLTTLQKIGLRYYYDLNMRIPRNNVQAIGAYIIAVVRSLGASCAEIVGSYRRGADTSGDIDIITSAEYSMTDLEKRLKQSPLFITTLYFGKERFSFLYCNDGIARSVDILRLKKDQYASGLLYFTGSWEFNAAMRGYAKKCGYTLNQQGLFKKNRLIKALTERDIFSKLGLKYIEPSDRTSPRAVIPLKK